MRSTVADRRLLVLAERQLWLVTRGQALKVGLSPDQIKARRDRGI